MSGAKAVLMREANCHINEQNDGTVSSEELEISHPTIRDEELAVKRTLLKKQRTSPRIVINRNGKRGSSSQSFGYRCVAPVEVRDV